ncbi:unnamed protein product [Dicrocoelium dendriticum]|nr:unnamed protein product [Dicrocoelium dendriticum]
MSRFTIRWRSQLPDCATMKCVSALTLAAVFVFFALFDVNEAIECRKLDEWCDGTLFNRCCGNLHCELKGFADGNCRNCLGIGSVCTTNDQCCSGLCAGLKCVKA